MTRSGQRLNQRWTFEVVKWYRVSNSNLGNLIDIGRSTLKKNRKFGSLWEAFVQNVNKSVTHLVIPEVYAKLII